MNNLTVENNNNQNNLNGQSNNASSSHNHNHNHHHHLKPRASIIGKLERSSFQAQRLSDVGIAFSQQITAKVGLKLPASQERIVEQTRWLYLRYVFVKLRQNKLPLRDLNLTKSSRARRAAALGASSEAQIIVSISEPPSADALTQSDQRPLFRPMRSNSMQRKRSALTTDIDSKHLSLLAARVNSKRQALRHQRECLDIELIDDEHNSFNKNNTYMVSSQLINNDNNSQTVAATTTTASTPLSSRLTSAALNLTSSSTSRLSNSFKRLSENFNFNSEMRTTNDTNDLMCATSEGISAAAAAPAAGPLISSNNNSRKYMMDPTINNQIFTVITNMIRQLRESKPEFYGDTIYEMIGLDKFSSLDSLLEVQKTLCQEMTRSEISWDRIVALFSLFGAMSLDCVRLGAPEHVGPILDGFIGFVERDLALWIQQQGGWESFLYKFRANYHYNSLYKVTAISVPLLILWAFLFAYTSSNSNSINT